MANNPPSVPGTILTEADYDTMNWHDNAVHAIAWEPLSDNPGRLLLDIDYILQWVAPDGIMISLGARGFTQYLRRPPVLCPRHILSVGERGGFGFDRCGYTP